MERVAAMLAVLGLAVALPGPAAWAALVVPPPPAPVDVIAPPASARSATAQIGGGSPDAVLPPDVVDRPGELTVARLEASIYSLPYVETKVDFKVEEDGTLVSRTVSPVFRFPWQVVDHSAGLNILSTLTIKVQRDQAFPLGEEERWVDVEILRKTVANDQRARPGARFERMGTLCVKTGLTYAEPVERYRVVLQASVTSPLTASTAAKERNFYVCLRPQWQGAVHQHEAIMKMMLLAHRRKLSLLRWRTWLATATLANRSLRDAAAFDGGQVLAALRDGESAARRDPCDEQLEQVAYDLMNESGRVLGRTTENVSTVSREILGVSRLSFSPAGESKRLLEDASDSLSRVAYYRNLLATLLEVERVAEVGQGIDRAIYFANEEAKALRFLWFVRSSGDLAGMLAKLKKALALEGEEVAALLRRLGHALGRSRESGGGWLSLAQSPVYAELYPKEALGDQVAVCATVRSLYQGLWCRLITDLFHLRVLSAAAERAVKPFELQAPAALLRPPLQNDALPPDLQVSVPLTGQNAAPGQVVHYPVTLRNLHAQSREVKLVEVRKLPSGWISRLSEGSVLLQPGEQKTVTYYVTAPYYTQMTMTGRSSVRLFFADDPGRFHEPAFQTRCVVGSTTEVDEDGSAPGRLFVQAPDSRAEIRPGGVASYTFVVRHDGPTKKLAKVDLVNEVAQGWVVDVLPKQLYLEPGLPERVTVKVTAPLYMKKTQRLELILGVGYADEFATVEKVNLTTLVTDLKVVQPVLVINNDQTATYLVRREGVADVAVTLRNLGTAPDTFDLFLSPPPPGWYVSLPQKTTLVEPGDKPVRVPLVVRAPDGARAGEHQTLHLTAVSVTHPEIRAQADLVFALSDDRQLEVTPVRRLVRVAPGDAADVTLNAVNGAETPVSVGFRPSTLDPRGTWLALQEPVRALAPGGTRLVSGNLRVPVDEKVGQQIPFLVSAVNDRGDEIGACTFQLAVCRRHAVDVVLDNDRTTRSQATVTCRLLVTNQGTVRDTIQLMLVGGVRRWLARLGVERVDLAAGETTSVPLVVKLPPNTPEQQFITIQVLAKSALDSSARDMVQVDVRP